MSDEILPPGALALASLERFLKSVIPRWTTPQALAQGAPRAIHFSFHCPKQRVKEKKARGGAR